MREQVPAHELDHLTAYTGASVGADLLNDLVCRQLANSTDAGYAISAKGRDAMAHIIAAAKAQEEDLGSKLGALELTALRNLLKRSIQQTDPGIAKLWKS